MIDYRRFPLEKKLSVKRVIVIAVFLSVPFFYFSIDIWHGVYLKMIGKKTIEDVIKEIEPGVKKNLEIEFSEKNLIYPPEKITFIAYKKNKIVELWVREKEKNIYFKSYIIHKSSGVEGPKLLEGDKQIPEGIYKIVSLNPNSKFYLSIELNYPNEYDRQKAELEKRTKPGTDIFIHGKASSVGCLAMGDEQIEEIFYLGAELDSENITVIIAPNREVENNRKDAPLWTEELYDQLKKELLLYKN
jgi:murein L,D-transpeptidase YafK